MSKDDDLKENLNKNNEPLSAEDYDKRLKEMEAEIKELKRIRRRRKKMIELEEEKNEVLRKMDKSVRSKRK